MVLSLFVSCSDNDISRLDLFAFSLRLVCLSRIFVGAYFGHDSEDPITFGNRWDPVNQDIRVFQQIFHGKVGNTFSEL